MNFSINSQVIENLDGYKSIIYIDNGSKKSVKDALAILARYFKREMCYDRLQFDESMYSRIDFTGFMLMERAMDLVENMDHYPNRVLGGGVFRQIDSSSHELDWVWIHPFARNRRKLLNHWSEFRSKFGDFSVAEPLSAHMASFIKKHHLPSGRS